MCITFDDGYRDNFEVALPILQRHRLKATFFVASGFLGDGRLFVDTVVEAVRRLPVGPVDLGWFGLGTCQADGVGSRRALIGKLAANIKYRSLQSRQEACERIEALVDATLPADLMMTPEQLRSMHRAGMSIGGHTLDHPILACLDEPEARRQILLDRKLLTSITGTAPQLFAYPNGRLEQDFNDAHVRMVRDAGYAGAVTTDTGCAGLQSDPHRLPRQSPWQQTSLRLVAGIARAMHSQADERRQRDIKPIRA
jgi:peptidoglycan/xylan/chitin deacetylase (PgdA/CDA1 family)